MEDLLTLCHGDAKPNNFMFRRIDIDLEDMECQGVESMLIDWQGGFLGWPELTFFIYFKWGD